LDDFEGKELKSAVSHLDQVVSEPEGSTGNQKPVSTEIHQATIWRLTHPVRLIGHQVLRAKLILRGLPYAVAMSGGYGGLTKNMWRTFRSEGIHGIKRRVIFSAAPGASTPVESDEKNNRTDYTEWVRRYDTLSDLDIKAIENRIKHLDRLPLISIVMPVYNPPLDMLEAAILSVQSQLYPNWELCIADDASTNVEVHELLKRYVDADSRIKVVFRKENGHISAASNSALALAKGEFVALLDNDDLLPQQALFWIADTIVTNPDVGLIYSDEDKIDLLGQRYEPYFKPDWNPDLFLSHNMVSHLGVYRTDLMRNLGGFREGYEGSQDYDLALRCSEQLEPRQIIHIPRVLYHWRAYPGSTALAVGEKNYALLAGERALNDHFSRIKVVAQAELLTLGMYRARYSIPTPSPLVSLIIPTRNGLALIKQCIDSIFAKTTYKNYEIIIVDNNSDDPETLDYFSSLSSHDQVRVLRDESPFNFSALNNTAVEQARGEYVGLINNDIEVISPEWLDEMIGLAMQSGVGAVGASLWYPNDTLQHGGVIIGLGGVANHAHKNLPRNRAGYFGRAQMIQTFSAVTAACLVIKKTIYQEVGGLNETNLKVAFNDVDFCLRVREAGYRNVWTPYAELYHHESATRGLDDTSEKQARFIEEVLYMKERWGELLKTDPAYSPNLTLKHEDFSYAWPPRVNE
jgi:glycosyltransferase involved in cell wall biosynthesis